MHLGINICSGTKGLGGALTNPTELSFRKGSIVNHYPITYEGTAYSDSEELFHKVKKHGFDFMACVLVTRLKLEQYPKLVTAITERGGKDWLARCWHETGAKTESFSAWEGTGFRSLFINALCESYILVSSR